MKIPGRSNGQGTLGEISRKNQYKTDYADESDSDMDFETDFLISPGDVYPNRKVKLEDAEISKKPGKSLKRCVNTIRKHSQKTTRT